MTDNFDALVIGTGQAEPSMAGRLTHAGIELAVRGFLDSARVHHWSKGELPAMKTSLSELVDRRSTFRRGRTSPSFRRAAGLLWMIGQGTTSLPCFPLALAMRRLRVVRHASAKLAHTLCWPVAEHHYGHLESHRRNALSAGMTSPDVRATSRA